MPFVIVRVGVPLPEAYSVTEPVPFVTEVFATYTLFDASTRTKTGTFTPLPIVSVGFCGARCVHRDGVSKLIRTIHVAGRIRREVKRVVDAVLDRPYRDVARRRVLGDRPGIFFPAGRIADEEIAGCIEGDGHREEDSLRNAALRCTAKRIVEGDVVIIVTKRMLSTGVFFAGARFSDRRACTVESSGDPAEQPVASKASAMALQAKSVRFMRNIVPG